MCAGGVAFEKPKGSAQPLFTLPAVITKDPKTGTHNVGMYRMQVIDWRLTFMSAEIPDAGPVPVGSAGGGSGCLPMGHAAVTYWSGIRSAKNSTSWEAAGGSRLLRLTTT
jgi:hypothetical protein